MSQHQDTALPLEVIRRDTVTQSPPPRRLRFRRCFLLVFLIPVFMFSGAVIGMYYQPPALQQFYAFTGLQPGAGSDTPIALPPGVDLPRDMAETMQVTDVVGLAKLIPYGDVSIVAPPYGAGDARIAEILVKTGDRVKQGSVVARLDNEAQLKSAVLLAEANVGIKEAALLQTRTAVQNSQDEARAGLEQAQSAAAAAVSANLRVQQLFQRGVTTEAALDAAANNERQAALAVEKAKATLARFTAKGVDAQPDVIVAERNLAAARADLTRARGDLVRSAVLAPISGIILDVNARAGERPPAAGIMQMGDTDRMMAEVEIYQDRIGAVAVGQPVELAAAAIGQTLQGKVQSIGLTVGRQDLVSSDTAAKTDARVITVMVALDPASSAVASRFTNLEVIARIDTRHVHRAQAGK